MRLFFDNARLGRLWDGFEAFPNLVVDRSDARLRHFADQVRSCFLEGKKVKAEVFDRTRPKADGAEHALIQVIVWREGVPIGQQVFQHDGLDLNLLVFRPVRELAFTYEPSTGVIEVVAERKAKCEELVRLFATELLGQKIEGQRIPLRHYDLSVFLREQDFSTDPEDRIEDVRPRQVTFESLGASRSLTIQTQEKSETVIAAASEMLVERSPFLSDGFRIREVVLVVRFHPDSVNPRGKTISIKLRHPNGCDLKEKSNKERKLGEKYLRRWGILKDISRDRDFRPDTSVSPQSRRD